MSGSASDDRLGALFAELVDASEPVRRQRLAEIRADDAGLAGELEELLALDREASVLDREIDASWMVSGVSAVGGADESGPFDDAEVGGYRVLGLLGRGGMGAVYRARQSEPDRVVALKLVRAGLLMPEAPRRLRFEADVLGRLSHPAIAAVFDAGTTTDGGVEVSYFAMELVDGCSIVEFAERRGLSVADRIGLMARVGDGVHHAHQRGVIHRDLKPANIMVTEVGEPKVLDFGIARLVEPGVQVTSAGAGGSSLVGTLAYMSPEQIEGDDSSIDVRTDVYALGAVLCELVTGAPPIDVRGMGLTRALDTLRNRRADRPRLRDGVRIGRDLETVIVKAIEADPDRRYGSAAEFSEDLRRVIRREPILARRATVGYRAGMFVRRNPAISAASVVACVMLVVGLGGVVFGYSQALERAEALEAANEEIALEARRADAVNRFLRRMLVSADPLGETGRGRADMTVLEMLDGESGAVGEAFAGLPASEASVRSTIGNVYMSLGAFERAEPELRASLALHEQVWGADSSDTDRARRDLAVLLAETDRPDEALAIFREILDRQIAEGRDNTIDHAMTATRASAILTGAGAYEDAERYLLNAVLIFESAGGEYADQHAATLNNLASVLNARGDRGGAEAMYVRARDAFENLHGAEHPSVAIASSNVAALRAVRGDHAGAAESYRRVIDILEPMMGAGHPTVATVRHNLGFALLDLGEAGAALAEFEVALEAFRSVYGGDHPEALTTQMAVADALLVLDRFGDAERVFADIERRRLGRDADDPRARRAGFYRGLSAARQGRADEGLGRMRRARGEYVALAGADDPTARKMTRDFAAYLVASGDLEAARGLAADLDEDDPADAAVLDEIRGAGR